MVHHDRELSPFRRTAVLLDVTTAIGAEDFVKASNKFTTPGDRFARQAFVELVQSLIFMSRVLVAHPTLSTPRPEDFGRRPWLLQTLMSAGLVQPLQLDSVATPHAADLEQQTLTDLQSWQGNKTLAQFIEQTLVCDREQIGMHNSLSGRIRGWPSSRQLRSVPPTAIGYASIRPTASRRTISDYGPGPLPSYFRVRCNRSARSAKNRMSPPPSPVV